MARKGTLPRLPLPGSRRRADVTSTTAEGNAWYFIRWFTTNRFRMIESFLLQIDHAPEPEDRVVLKRRYLRAAKHGQRAMVVRLVVTILVLLSLGSSGVAAVVDALEVLPGASEFVTRVKTIAASLGVLLIAARLAMDRHLERVQIYLTFTGMQIAGRRGLPGDGSGTSASSTDPGPQ